MLISGDNCSKIYYYQTAVALQNLRFFANGFHDSVTRVMHFQFNSFEKLIISPSVFFSSVKMSWLLNSRNICLRRQQGNEKRKIKALEILCLSIKQLTHRRQCFNLSNKWCVSHGPLETRMKIRSKH